MGVKQYQKGIKKRREERLRLLRARQRRLGSGASSLDRNPIYSSGSYAGVNRSSNLLFKTVCALLLFTIVFLVMNANHPQLDQAQTFIRQVMTQDANWDEVREVYQSLVGNQAGFLPRFLVREGESGEENHYVVPVSGAKVISDFNENRRGIVLETGSTLPVEVVKEGWITFVGEREGLGRTVIINHGQGEESWYGRLQEINVQLYDWVEQGQVVGTTSVPEGQDKGVLYFAIRKDSEFINPLDVISFE